MGTATGDDAAVWRLSADRALIATVDFFTPLVEDPFTWGAIAATNAASDVYAMGGRPLFALNVVAWPRERLPLDILGDALAGAADAAARGGWLVVGGHTVDGEEPLLGQAVIGEVHPDHLLTNAGARPGQSIVLTKALGTGLVATAVKRSPATAISADGVLYDAYTAAVSSMTLLNGRAAAVAQSFGATAATDITGFGLLGHLQRVAAESAVHIELHGDAVPRLTGAEALIAAGFVPGGTLRNLEFLEPHISGQGRSDWDEIRYLLADPQTSGGLAFFCDPAAAVTAVQELALDGHAAAVIGTVTDGPAGTIAVR